MPDDQLDGGDPAPRPPGSASSTAGVRWRPAVGAATDPGRSANTVW